MSKKPHGASVLLTVAFLSIASVALATNADANKAKEVFESLYGQDVKRAEATRDTKDDLKLAAKLLAAARTSKAHAELLALLCEKACDLGSKAPGGYETALEAMELLAEHVPEKVDACDENILKIRQKQYDISRGERRGESGEFLIQSLIMVAGAKTKAHEFSEAQTLYRKALAVAKTIRSERKSEIEQQIKYLAQTRNAARRIDNLKERLKTSPEDILARNEIIRLYLVDFDDPVQAVKYIDDNTDVRLRRHVPAAAKGVKDASEKVCLELGDWYRNLGNDARAPVKAAMLTRAHGYYENFLSLHEKEDISRIQASLALEKVEGQLKELGTPVPGNLLPGKWIDLLKLIDLEKDTVSGKWRREGKSLVVTSSRIARIVIPVAPAGSYELQVRLLRTAGNNSLSNMLPVGSAHVAFILHGYKGTASGLHLVDGKKYWLNETTVRPGKVPNGKEHALNIKILTKGKQARIFVTLNGKPYIQWQGLRSSLSMSKEWEVPNPKCLGLGARYSTVIFKSVRLRMLSGKARMLRTWGKKKK